MKPTYTLTQALEIISKGDIATNNLLMEIMRMDKDKYTKEEVYKIDMAMIKRGLEL